MRYLLLLFFAINIFSAKAQQMPPATGDTAEVLAYSALFYEGSNGLVSKLDVPDKKLFYAKKMLSLSQQLKYKRGIAAGYSSIGLVYMFKKGYTNEALENFRAAEIILSELNDTAKLGGVLCNIAIEYKNKGRLQPALDNLLEAKRLLEKTHDFLDLANTYCMLGVVSEAYRNYTWAIEDYQGARRIYEKYGKKSFLADIDVHIATVLIRQKKYVEAGIYAQSALDIAKEVADKNLVTSAEECLAYINRHK